MATIGARDDRKDAIVPLSSAPESSSDDPDGPALGVGEDVSLHVVVVAEDEAERARLTALIGATPGMRCSDGARDWPEAGEIARPDVVLLHLDPQAPGAERRLREVLASWQPAPVLVLSGSSDSAVNREFVRKGARGVVPKSAEQVHLVAAVRRVKDGEIWLPRTCLSIIIDEMAASNGPRPGAHPRDLFATLTEREREVVLHIAKGLHNRAIADRLGITENTVRHHLTAIYGKLGVTDRLKLAVLALRHGAIGRDESQPPDRRLRKSPS